MNKYEILPVKRIKNRQLFIMCFLFVWLVWSKRADAAAIQNGKTYALFINGISSDAAGTDAVNGVSGALKKNKLYNSDFIDDYVCYDTKTNPIPGSKFKSYIREAYSVSTSNDLCIFYYFGHTFNGMGLSTTFDTSSKIYDSVPFFTLAEELSKVNCGTMLVILDCCFSENFIEHGIMLLNEKERDKFVVLTSSLSDEESQFKKNEYSRFSKAMYSGLSTDNVSLYADMDHNQVVTAKELYDYLYVRMADDLLEVKGLWWKENVWEDQMPRLYPEDSEFPIYSNQELIDESGNEDQTIQNLSSEAVKIVSKIKSMPYIGGTLCRRSVLLSDEGYIRMDSLSLCGILGASYIDMDFDGENEILSVTYEPSDIMGGKENSLRLCVLEKNTEGWRQCAETEILSTDREENYTDVSSINEGSPCKRAATVFVRKYKGNVEVFFESYYEGVFATGQGWFLRGYHYNGSSFSQIEETKEMNWEGSPIYLLWSESEDNIALYFAAETAAMIKRYRALGFTSDIITTEVMSPDYIDKAYRMISIHTDCTTSWDVINAWYGEKNTPLDAFQFYIDDSSADVPENLEETYSVQEIDDEDDSTEYILPGAATEYLDDIIQCFDSDKAQLAINEIYARHGRVFITPQNDEYFRQKSWYQPDPEKTDEQILAELNDFETHNMDLLISKLQ